MGKIHVKVSVYRDYETDASRKGFSEEENLIPLKTLYFLNKKNAQINLMRTFDSLT